MNLTNTKLDLEFVRSQFPAFKDPICKDWSFFENAGGSYVPKQVINKKTTQLLQSFIKMQVNENNSNPPIYLSLVENQPYKVDDLYIANCSVCHGLNGAGDGFNAKYLPVSPGNLSDSEVISKRSDNTLYETLYNGGRIMKKHHFMPSWGLKLSHKEIVYLVSRIRQLCNCDTPNWSEN